MPRRNRGNDVAGMNSGRCRFPEAGSVAMLFCFYDLRDMKKRILFSFYHLAKNRGGEGGISGVQTGEIPVRSELP
jgi:hypothetical protein